MVKAILLVCATALFAESTLAQCLGRAGIAAPIRGGYGAYGAGCGCGGYGVASDIAAASSLNAACGGSLGVATGSCVGPTGLNVASDNVYEGTLAVGGNLPFLGTVALEGVFPTAGAGAVSYGCGDGAVGITAEGGAPAGYSGIGYGGLGYSGLGYNGLGSNGLGYNGLGYRGFAGRVGGCGCGAIY